MTELELECAWLREMARTGELDVLALRRYHSFVRGLTRSQLAVVVHEALEECRRDMRRPVPDTPRPVVVPIAPMPRPKPRLCRHVCEERAEKRGMCEAHYRRWRKGLRGWELERPIRGRAVPESVRRERVRALGDGDRADEVMAACAALGEEMRADVAAALWIRLREGEADADSLGHEARAEARRWHRANRDGYDHVSLDLCAEGAWPVAETIPEDQWERAHDAGWI